METYYCDGSQHRELNKLAVGVVNGTASIYYDTEDFEWERSTHEVVAITKAINYALKKGSSNIVVVNDDKHLVRMIQCAKVNQKMKSKGWKNRTEFKRLVSLIKQHDVLVRTPVTVYDKEQILKCHKLSRSYLQTV